MELRVPHIVTLQVNNNSAQSVKRTDTNEHYNIDSSESAPVSEIRYHGTTVVWKFLENAVKFCQTLITYLRISVRWIDRRWGTTKFQEWWKEKGLGKYCSETSASEVLYRKKASYRGVMLPSAIQFALPEWSTFPQGRLRKKKSKMHQSKMIINSMLIFFLRASLTAKLNGIQPCELHVQ